MAMAPYAEAVTGATPLKFKCSASAVWLPVSTCTMNCAPERGRSQKLRLVSMQDSRSRACRSAFTRVMSVL